MEEKFNCFLDYLKKALVSIDKDYMKFPTAGEETPVLIERERVYCYELYHQLRYILDSETFPFQLNAEPNKRGHHFIKEACGIIDPDFIVHVAGEMGSASNLCVIEVKRSKCDLVEGIDKDLNTLTCMTTIPNGYYGGIEIIFGELNDDERTNIIETMTKKKSPDTKRLVLVLHAHPQQEPELIEVRNL